MKIKENRHEQINFRCKEFQSSLTTTKKANK